MNKDPAQDAQDSHSIDPSGFDGLERATGIGSFKLDDDSRHRLEWALFWARANHANKAQVDIANLIIELAVQYARAAQKSVLASDAASDKASSKAKEPAVTPSFFGFVRSALAFVPEAGKLSDTELHQHIRRALATARRQKDDPKSRMPPDRREELDIALAK